MKAFAGALIALGIAAPGAALAAPIANGQGWTGFYLGGNLGAVRPDFDGVFDTGDVDGIAVDFDDLDDWLFEVGGQIGYDWQAPGMGGIVLGVVLDASWLSGDLDATDSGGGFNDNDVTAEFDWLASVRLRAGYPVADIMPYVTVGAAYTEFSVDHTRERFDPGNPLEWSLDEQEWGFVGGFGLDWAVASNVTVGAEALFYAFDYEQDLSGFPDGEAGDKIEFDRMMNYRLTVNYRF